MNDSSVDKEPRQREVEKDFFPLCEQLRSIEREYNPENENLHFSMLCKADNALFEKLHTLARTGLIQVKLHHDFFIKGRLYDDSFFWYDLCLLISSAAMTAKSAKLRLNKNTIKEIAQILVDISVYATATGGDMGIRNYEALGNILIAFYNKDLIHAAIERSEHANLNRVKDFVKVTISKIEKIRAKEK